MGGQSMLDQVLLIDVESDIEQKEISSRLAKSGQPPLGLLYLVAYAQDKFPDVDFRIFHTATTRDPEKEIESILREFKPQLVQSFVYPSMNHKNRVDGACRLQCAMCRREHFNEIGWSCLLCHWRKDRGGRGASTNCE